MSWSRGNAAVSLFLALITQICTGDYLIRTKNPPVLRVSTIMAPAFAQRRSVGTPTVEYYGFMPQFLAELETRKAFSPFQQEIFPATNNEIGRILPSENWTGLINDVMSGSEAKPILGAGPILENVEYNAYVQQSKPWRSVGLTLVARKTSNVTSLRNALERQQLKFSAVNNSSEFTKLHRLSANQSAVDVADLYKRLKRDSKFFGSMTEGLNAVARKDVDVLLINTHDSRYYVTHDFCQLEEVPEFQNLGKYVFTLTSQGNDFIDKLNLAIQQMVEDGSIEKLLKKELGTPGMCNKAAFGPATSVIAFMSVALTKISVRIFF